MSFLTQLLVPLQYCEDAAIQLCKKMRLPVTATTVRKDLLEHADYPSLTSIMDVLKSYGVRNEAYKLEQEHLNELPLPFIAHISGDKLKHHLFAPVWKVTGDTIELYNPETRKQERWEKERFAKRYQGVILAVEAGEHAGEREYKKALKEEKHRETTFSLLAFGLPVLMLLLCLLAIFQNPAGLGFTPVIFSLFTLAGCMVTALLLWHEVDEYNPALRQICTAGGKVNCSAVLRSKGSKIFGQSWSSIGACYFFGMLIVLMTAGLTNKPILQLLGWVNLLALPYIGFSIYYQWKVAKQWCTLCLLVQGLLLLQFTAALAGGFHLLVPLADIQASAFLSVLTSFVLVFMVISLLMPALEKAKEGGFKSAELRRIKHNPQIFEALLAKEKTIADPTEGLGITLGKPDARYKVIKVCNPYCGPCASAHPVIDELIENNEEIQLQIIFTVSQSEKDSRIKPVTHLLAIAENGNSEEIRMALDDWYLPEKKEYNTFASKYPMNGQLQQQGEKIRSMEEWCKTNEIVFTPTFFISTESGDSLYQLPRFYSIHDLKYLLTP
jgi:uncharacterized membrane protein